MEEIVPRAADKRKVIKIGDEGSLVADHVVPEGHGNGGPAVDHHENGGQVGGREQVGLGPVEDAEQPTGQPSEPVVEQGHQRKAHVQEGEAEMEQILGVEVITFKTQEYLGNSMGSPQRWRGG